MKKLLTPLAATFVLVACGESGTTPDPSGTTDSSSTTSTGAASTTTNAVTTSAPSGTTAATSTSSTGSSGGSGPSSSGAPTTAPTSTNPTSTGAEGSSSNAPDSQTTSAASDSTTTDVASSGTDTSASEPGPATCPYVAPELPDPIPDGWSSDEVTLFNDNGGWTWYNDERVLVDIEGGKIVVSSAASNATNQSANPNIDFVIHDLATGMNEKMSLGNLSYSDDHNNGGIIIKAPGSYFVGWTHHNVDCLSHFRNYDDGQWGAADQYDWKAEGHGCITDAEAGGSGTNTVTYNNPYNMSAEGRYYNFVRSIQTSPNLLVSEDEGKTWTLGGRLTASPQTGYNAGYYKFWGNGVDRVDFFATEAHPRDADTSVFHGYIKGGKSYDSFDKEIDDNINDTTAPEITKFTKVFAAHSMLNGVELNALWNFDIARYDDGTIGVLWQGRMGARGVKDDAQANHRIAYSRFDGEKWTSTYLVRGGRTLYRNRSDWWEEDYLGGAALDPDDPHVIYVSSPIDPRDDSTTYDVHEIWKGVTCDDGATFTWTPMTMNSAHENLRPVVPKWDSKNSALLWFRGNYQTAQMFDAEVVGILKRGL